MPLNFPGGRELIFKAIPSTDLCMSYGFLIFEGFFFSSPLCVAPVGKCEVAFEGMFIDFKEVHLVIAEIHAA